MIRRTKRYGPEVQGAGIHHNPTPGPVGAKFLYGHSWVTLGRIVRHDRCGAIGLPLLGRLYIRHKDIPKLPDEVDWEFRTKPQLAAELISWAETLVGEPAERPWVVVDGGYANREFLKPASAHRHSRPSPSCGVMRGSTTCRRYPSRGICGGGAARRPTARIGSAWPSGLWHQRLLAGGAGEDHQGPGVGPLGQDVPGDLATGRGRDPGGDPAGGGWLVAGLPLHRSRGFGRRRFSRRASIGGPWSRPSTT